MAYIETYSETGTPATADDPFKMYREVRLGNGSIRVFDAVDMVVGYTTATDPVTKVETVTVYYRDAASGGGLKQFSYSRLWSYGEPQTRVRDGRGY